LGKKLDYLEALLIIVILPTLMFAVIHEQRHKTIAENFGCNAEISYLPDLSENAFMYTSINCPESVSESDEKLMWMMQSNVETTGYQLIPILMMTMMTLILVYPKKKYGEKQKKGDIR